MLQRYGSGIDEQQSIEPQKIEDNILSIISKIKKDRNRACVQNIHTFINRRGIDIQEEDVPTVIDNLLLRNIIVDKGKGKKESFFIVDLPSESDENINKSSVEHESSDENINKSSVEHESSDENINKSSVEHESSDENINKSSVEHESSLNALHEFIDESFYTILMNKIKSEVKAALNDSLNNDAIQLVKNRNKKN